MSVHAADFAKLPDPDLDATVDALTEDEEKQDRVTAKQAVVTKKADGVTKKRGRPAVANAMSTAERQRAFRERHKAKT